MKWRQRMKKNNLIILMLLVCVSTQSFAVRESRPTPIDSRIRIMVYSPDDVFKFTGYYNYQASIELGDSEEVSSLSMGDTTGWQIVPSGNRIFLKPVERDATTNMTLITNKRTYYFELYAEEAQDIRDPNMVFNVKFIYPDDEAEDNLKTYSNSSSADLPNLDHPEDYNFNYTISGHEDIAPIKIFDDGQFTYLQFRDRNNNIPAIFAVDPDLKEEVVNYRPSKADANLIIVERVYKKLSLRVDKKIVCIFNEAFRLN
jgi:type IV secretion system protein VirB9